MKPHHLAESHRRQFEGEDYQQVSYAIANREGIDPEKDPETIADLQSSPQPDCECGFCKTAIWE